MVSTSTPKQERGLVFVQQCLQTAENWPRLRILKISNCHPKTPCHLKVELGVILFCLLFNDKLLVFKLLAPYQVRLCSECCLHRHRHMPCRMAVQCVGDLVESYASLQRWHLMRATRQGLCSSSAAVINSLLWQLLWGKGKNTVNISVSARSLRVWYNNIESLVRNLSCRYINNSTLLKFAYQTNKKVKEDEKDMGWQFSFVTTADIIVYLLMF